MSWTELGLDALGGTTKLLGGVSLGLNEVMLIDQDHLQQELNSVLASQTCLRKFEPFVKEECPARR